MHKQTSTHLKEGKVLFDESVDLVDRKRSVSAVEDGDGDQTAVREVRLFHRRFFFVSSFSSSSSSTRTGDLGFEYYLLQGFVAAKRIAIEEGLEVRHLERRRRRRRIRYLNEEEEGNEYENDAS